MLRFLKRSAYQGFRCIAHRHLADSGLVTVQAADTRRVGQWKPLASEDKGSK